MTALYKKRAIADAAVEKIKVFAQPQRLMVLSFLLDGEHSVAEIDSATGIGQPALSQQLAELRRAGLVRTRKETKSVYYALIDESTALCVRALEVIMDGGDGDKSSQLARLLNCEESLMEKAESSVGTAAFARTG